MEEFKTNGNDVESIKQRQKEIACQCLKNFGLLENVQKEFADTGKLYYSERTTKVFDGILYWMSNHPEWEERIKKLEEEYGILVYHAFNLTEPMFSEFGSGAYRPCNGGISKTA